ncbi:MAG: DUF2085 domain-containing protein [Pyrinomonadaceae bacterium]
MSFEVKDSTAPLGDPPDAIRSARAAHPRFTSADQYVPQFPIRNPQSAIRNRSVRNLMAWVVAAVGTLAFVALVFAAPLALERGHGFVAAVLYESFGRICHQLPARSYFWHGHPLAVCARCLGVYAGFALGVVLYPLARSLRRTDAPPRRWLLVAAAPLVVDFSLTFFGLWENTHTSRLLTGALLGAGASLYVVPGLVDLFAQAKWGRRTTQAASPTSQPLAVKTEAG